MPANFVLEQGQWRLQWDDGLILPELAGGNVLKMDYQIPARGDIYDHTGLPIVAQSDAYALGITPGQMTNKSEGHPDRRAFEIMRPHSRRDQGRLCQCRPRLVCADLRCLGG